MSNNSKTSTEDEAAKTVPVFLYRDYWGEGGIRHAKGSIIEVGVTAAKVLMGEGKAERADPLPGDEG